MTNIKKLEIIKRNYPELYIDLTINCASSIRDIKHINEEQKKLCNKWILFYGHSLNDSHLTKELLF